MGNGGLLISVICKKCGKENAVIIPVEVSEEEWIQAQKKMDKSETNLEVIKFKKEEVVITYSRKIDLGYC